jgi:AcrR family transcriptional regulator
LSGSVNLDAMNETFPGARPLRRDAELNRQRIMTAAREVFAERGLDVTLDEIAHHAGLGVGTVYRRFPNREALIDALFEETFQQIIELTEEVAAGPDPWEGFVRWMSELVALQAKDRGLRDVLLSSGYGRDRVAQLRDRLSPLLEQLVDRAQQEGPLRADLRASDVAVLQLMIASAAEFTRDAADSDVWRRYLTIMIDGLCVRRDQPSLLPVGVLGDEEVEAAMRGWPPSRRW